MESVPSPELYKEALRQPQPAADLTDNAVIAALGINVTFKVQERVRLHLFSGIPRGARWPRAPITICPNYERSHFLYHPVITVRDGSMFETVGASQPSCVSPSHRNMQAVFLLECSFGLGALLLSAQLIYPRSDPQL